MSVLGRILFGSMWGVAALLAGFRPREAISEVGIAIFVVLFCFGVIVLYRDKRNYEQIPKYKRDHIW
jgi:hypothetical protein